MSRVQFMGVKIAHATFSSPKIFRGYFFRCDYKTNLIESANRRKKKTNILANSFSGGIFRSLNCQVGDKFLIRQFRERKETRRVFTFAFMSVQWFIKFDGRLSWTNGRRMWTSCSQSVPNQSLFPTVSSSYPIAIPFHSSTLQLFSYCLCFKR